VLACIDAIVRHRHRQAGIRDPPGSEARTWPSTTTQRHNTISGRSLKRSFDGGAADHNGGSARSYLTLSTLATVRQSQDGHPDHRVIMPFQHGFLSLRWSCCPVRRRCAG